MVNERPNKFLSVLPPGRGLEVQAFSLNVKFVKLCTLLGWENPESLSRRKRPELGLSFYLVIFFFFGFHVLITGCHVLQIELTGDERQEHTVTLKLALGASNT